MSNMIKALEQAIEQKTQEIHKLAKSKAKAQKITTVKEELYRYQRMIAKEKRK